MSLSWDHLAIAILPSCDCHPTNLWLLSYKSSSDRHVIITFQLCNKHRTILSLLSYLYALVIGKSCHCYLTIMVSSSWPYNYHLTILSLLSYLHIIAIGPSCHWNHTIMESSWKHLVSVTFQLCIVIGLCCHCYRTSSFCRRTILWMLSYLMFLSSDYLVIVIVSSCNCYQTILLLLSCFHTFSIG